MVNRSNVQSGNGLFVVPVCPIRGMLLGGHNAFANLQKQPTNISISNDLISGAASDATKSKATSNSGRNNSWHSSKVHGRNEGRQAAAARGRDFGSVYTAPACHVASTSTFHRTSTAHPPLPLLIGCQTEVQNLGKSRERWEKGGG